MPWWYLIIRDSVIFGVLLMILGTLSYIDSGIKELLKHFEEEKNLRELIKTQNQDDLTQ